LFKKGGYMNKEVFHKIIQIICFFIIGLFLLILREDSILPFVNETTKYKMFRASVPSVLIFYSIFEIATGYSTTQKYINSLKSKKIKFLLILFHILTWLVIIYLIFFHF